MLTPTLMAPSAPHEPVLADQVTRLLVEAPPGAIVDATVGAGGHAGRVLDARHARYGDAELIGIDRDTNALDLAAQQLGPQTPHRRYDLVHARFDQLGQVLDDLGQPLVSGIVFDLGVSSMQLDQAHRGFSYRDDAPIDMRMDTTVGVDAHELVNHTDVAEIAQILREYGEERFAHRIAAAIVDARPIESTVHLAQIVRDAVPAAARRTGGHPATRTFQALRIAVNEELTQLAAVLPVAVERLAPGGVLVVIAYHSLEDRIVKRTFVDLARDCVCPPRMPVCACGARPQVEPLTRRPIMPDANEIDANPRARSARLRAVRRLAGGDTDLGIDRGIGDAGGVAPASTISPVTNRRNGASGTSGVSDVPTEHA